MMSENPPSQDLLDPPSPQPEGEKSERERRREGKGEIPHLKFGMCVYSRPT